MTDPKAWTKPSIPDFEVLRSIARGASGEVWLAQTSVSRVYRGHVYFNPLVFGVFPVGTDSVLSHCRWPLHTSLLEGFHNKIKVVKRTAHGFRDDEYFLLKIRQAFPGNP